MIYILYHNEVRIINNKLRNKNYMYVCTRYIHTYNSYMEFILMKLVKNLIWDVT